MRHEPVLRQEVIDHLELCPDDKVIDATVGDGGHTEALLTATAPKGHVLALDADAESLLRAEHFLYHHRDRVTFVRSNFSHLHAVAQANNFIGANAVLMDLGWSMPQFKERGRGFSFERNEPLDMRYDVLRGDPTAKDVLATYSATELARVLKTLGEEPLYQQIAEAIVHERKQKPLVTSGDLVEIVLTVYREKLSSKRDVPWIGGIHPATRTFQALRIAVNKEFEVLKEALPQALDVIGSGGKIAVITFHSLEDRIVKQFFVRMQALGTIRTKKPCTATAQEIMRNPAARSAKLRVFQKR